MLHSTDHEFITSELLLSPGLKETPVLELMCSFFVLTLAARQGPKFNIRRDLNNLLSLTGRHMVWPEQVLSKLRSFLALRCKDNDYWKSHEQLSNEVFLERHGVWRGPYEEGSLFFYLDEYAKDQPKDLLCALYATTQWIGQSVKKHDTLVEKNIDKLSLLLNLNPAEKAVLLLGTLARYQRDLRSLLVEFKVSNAPEAYEAIAQVAGVQANEIAEALRAGSRLERIGMVENLISEHSITDLSDLMKVSDKLPSVLMREYRDQNELMAVFTSPSSPTSLHSNDFSYVQNEVEILSQLLQQSSQNQQEGVNILVYGPPGTGKTELAKVIAQNANLQLFEVEYADRDGNSLSGKDRYRSLQMAQVFLKNNSQVALLFDEVEDVFPTISPDTAQLISRQDNNLHPSLSSVNGKAWVNQILETNPVPTIWITNRIEQIDPAFRRRFAYHLELQSPPPKAREQLIRKTLEGVTVSEALINQLSERKDLTPAQIRTAVKFANLVQNQYYSIDFLIHKQLKNADAALGLSDQSSSPTPHVTQYNLSVLNLESRFEIQKIIQSLKARGHGTLCFFGPPGTGKTALATHIAEQLGQTLLIKQASDLISKYVGETEKNLANMFQQATTENAVLLLDEADSFFQDRRGAQRNYEVTEVNEMLQQMERFKGIFICTTNFMDKLDQASLRRFTFKIQFKPLSQAQKLIMFTQEANLAKNTPISEEIQNRLQKLDHLCLGDFAAVKKQMLILDEIFSPIEFLEQLEAEHHVKPQVREHKPIGFTGFN
jgi:SpoVK/Ycf46/Vps4 family AAA+-type ATPase